ncbi:alpha-2-macroglobulin family protein [Spirosoma soli]|uniref:Alpha-2-macroglobulin family protein n=1 Tax=Spirosoma soli TaxID=1770529 RepID=A0ABW5MBW4_9BACT
MNRTLVFILLFITVCLAASAQNRQADANLTARSPLPDYARDWRQADSLAAKGLPKSALTIANRIYKEAKANQNYPQVAKAAIHRMIFRSYSDEEAYVELVRSMQTDIRDTPEPARSVLQSALADIYWRYFQRNRYKFYNRSIVGKSANGTKPGADSTNDFTTWDARQLVEAATAGFLASVRDKEALQKIPVSHYDALIDKGDAETRPLRPTLYDLLAHRAIDFFQNTEPDLLKPVFRFELDEATYLAKPETFAQLALQSKDSLSGRYQALRLYQQLLAFHLSDADPSALADVDVLRLSFVHRHSVVSDKDSLYRQTLRQQAARFKGQLAEAIYGYQLAEFLSNRGTPVRPLQGDDNEAADDQPDPNRWNRKQAADLCQTIIKNYPKTFVGKQASLLLNRLLQSTYSLNVEQVTMPNYAFRALVSYQNVSRIKYRIARLSAFEMTPNRPRYTRSEEEQQTIVKYWLKRSAMTEGTVSLPNDGDLNLHSVEIPLAGLPLGQYVVFITAEDTFKEDTDLFQYATFAVSSLGYIIRNDVRSGGHTIFVANRQTGEPLTGATINLVLGSKALGSSDAKVLRTDATGKVNLLRSDVPSQENYQYLLTVGKDTLLSDVQYSSGYYNNTDDPSVQQTRLFTDRAIYRPGQLIYVKGLVYEGKSNQYEVIADQQVKIELRDQNGEQVAQQTLKTNEFGTFNTSFTAPVGRVTGVMTLQTPFGSTAIRIEEYKRPTFEVATRAVRQSFKLGQTITVTADAKTLSGAVVDGAQVRYRVVRRLRPRWDWYSSWKRGFSRTGEAEVSNGTAVLDAKGSVSLSFLATPDRDQKPADNPIFDFELTIDVTDRAGETRSTTKVFRIGYSALQTELAIPAQVDKGEPAAFPLRIINQSGENVRATGQLMVYRLQAPNRLLRNRLWARPDHQLLSRGEYEKLFPNDIYATENNPRSWPKGEMVQQLAINAPADSLIKPEISKYLPGEYVAEVKATDSTGETTSERAFFTVVDGQQPTASKQIEAWVQDRKTTAEPGENALFWVGNAQPGWVLMSVEENHRIVRQEWLKTNGQPQRVTLPVTEKQRGGFAVHFAMIQNGRFYEKTYPITVPLTNKQLQITTQTFRSKLKPGEREEWTLAIAGLNKTPAEVIATLYDASLDAFDKLDWPTTFYQSYYPTDDNWQVIGFLTQQSNSVRYQYQPQLPTPARRYDQLGWSGYRLSLNGGRPFGHSPVGPFGVSDQALRVTVRRVGKVITGTVKNPNGSGAPRISVMIKDATVGVTTDQKGAFSLSTASESKPVTLVFAGIGYVTNEATIKQKPISLRLQPDVQSLDEVTVTGYATQRKSDVTGATSIRLSGVARTMAAESAAMPAVMELKEAVAAEQTNRSNKIDQPVSPRRNFNETAFFFPELKTDSQGRIVLKFTMPEALTRWRLLAFAHTKDLKTGMLEREIITQKELMITANAPRFFREGDTIRLTARVNNLTNKKQSGTASLELTDALSGEPINPKLKLANSQAIIAVDGGQSQSVGWTLIVPAGIERVTCRLTARADGFTDGEEFTVPVLPNRMLVTDTQPFWVNGSESKEFKLKELTNLNPELPIQHERLTVEVTSNPAWYALQSLPYLMEYRYECAEQLFSRLYANSLAAHIVNSKPAFRQVIAEWQKNPPRNPLQANEELKAVTLENSPWLADARSEANRQAQLGQLFDQNRMNDEQQRTFDKLRQLQTESGGFRWFGGMEPNLSITLHILSDLGHLQKLGVKFPEAIQAQIVEMQTKAIRYADAEMKQLVADQQKRKPGDTWSFGEVQYLYARSFYVDQPINKDLLTYLKQRVSTNWLKQSLQGQAFAALALARFGDGKTADGILRSLLERTRTSEELGTYWPDNQSGLRWYETPIETQAYLIEALDELNQNRTLIDNMKRWLIRQKQTQSWSSTKATTEAVYALLLRGSDWLDTKNAPRSNVQVSVGGQPIESRASKTEAIMGYQKVIYAAAEIKPEMGAVKIVKKTDGPAWGALYWQHFESLDRVMPGSAGLSIQKALFVQRDSPGGPVITPVSPQTALKPGDLIKVRLVVKTDRAMEYVHLKDGRASGFEPVATLSGYKYQNGIGYYESPRDASTDFFLSYLPVGTHVFEYDLRVAQTGDFSAGVATVQCFYAPEFSAHSAGERVRVKP